MSRRLLLSQLIDLGGAATKNNFYSPSAGTVKGSRLQVHKYFNEFLKAGYIKLLKPPIKVKNQVTEYFYCITKSGTSFANRPDDYKWNDKKSPNNVMHESMVRDVALSFLRNFKGNISIKYDLAYDGIRPDITVRMNDYVFFVEIERKETVDRVYREKVLRYEKLFKSFDYGKHNIPKQIKVLFLWANYLEWDGFLRPQEYDHKKIEAMENQLQNIFKFTSALPDRYRFTTFNNFHRIHEPIWYNVKGEKLNIVH